MWLTRSDKTVWLRLVISSVDNNKGTDDDYLVRTATVVPIPAAVSLFGTALVGLVGLGRRKSAQAA